MNDRSEGALRAKEDSLRERIRELDRAISIKISTASLNERIGDRSVSELLSLAPREVGEFLRSIDDEAVMAAYLLLSYKLDCAELAKICLEYLRRPGASGRLAGSFGLGSSLKGTKDVDAFRALCARGSKPGGGNGDQIGCIYEFGTGSWRREDIESEGN